jgi:D-glycero-D-manno-heptose 1,7-bisphosphate phosphatase
MSSELRKAVFLDRDGVINEERGDYTWQLEDFRINPGVVEALLELQSKGFLLIVISNQGGIAKGLYTKAEVDYLHLHLERFLANHGVKLAGFYYCPHHPETGNCICRKPDSLLLEKACAAHGIEPSASYFIGDAQRDADAAKKAFIHPIQIPSNTPLIDALSKIKLI